MQSASKGYAFKNIFDFTTAGDWDFVAAVERLPALHYSVDVIFLSFGIMGFISFVEKEPNILAPVHEKEIKYETGLAFYLF